MRTETISKAITILAGLLLLHAAIWINSQIYSSLSPIQRINFYGNLGLYVAYSLILIMFGMLVERRRIINLFEKGASINRLMLALSMLLTIASLISYAGWIHLLGLKASGLLGLIEPLSFILRAVVLPFQNSLTHAAISVVAGILLVRSLYNKDD